MLFKLIALTVVLLCGFAAAVGTSRAQESTTETGGVTEVKTTPTVTQTQSKLLSPNYKAMRGDIRDGRARVNAIRQNRCYARIQFRLTVWEIPRNRLSRAARFWTRRPSVVRDWVRRCPKSYLVNLGSRLGYAVWKFRERSDAKCVRAHEAAYQEWTNPTYDGAWQADNTFESAYGWGFVRRWGNMNDSKPDWPAYAQDTMAYRGHQARGWQPWPTYTRYCA